MSPEMNLPSRKTITCLLIALAILVAPAAAQKDKDTDDEPSAKLSFLILKEDNGKPVRNAAVIMHAVNSRGKQERGGIELKTDVDGKASFDGIPYGKLRVQVLASGFQTFGDDYDITKGAMDFTIKLNDDPKKTDKTPPPDPNAKPQ